MTSQPVRSRLRREVTARLLPVVSVLAAVAAATMLPVLAAPAAWAHSSLISSSPAADSVLATPPARIELVFNEQIRDFQPTIAITVGDQDPIEVTPVVDGATVTADLTGMAWPSDAGTGSGTGSVAWKVGYRVVSADGHPVSGLVPFSVGDGPAPTAGSAVTSTAPAEAADTGGSAPASADQGPSAGAWVAVAVIAAAAVGAAGLLLLRRRRAATGPAAGTGDPAVVGDGADGGATAGPGGNAGGRGPVRPAQDAGR